MPLVGEHALDLDAELGAERACGALKEGHRLGGALVCEDLAVGKARVIVDGHMQVLPAGAGTSLDTVGEDRLSDLPRATKALGVDVQQLADRTQALLAS